MEKIGVKKKEKKKENVKGTNHSHNFPIKHFQKLNYVVASVVVTGTHTHTHTHTHTQYIHMNLKK